MALKSEDLGSGFRHGKVMAFINERMSRHAKGPEFYLENLSLSWEKVEDKLRAILEDRLVPSQAKEACAWSTLALGVRFAHKQSQLHRHRVQWLHDFAGLHRSASQALTSDLKLLAAQYEVERKEAAFRLQLIQASLVEVQKERDFLKWKLFKAVRLPSPVPRPAPPIQSCRAPPHTPISGQVTTLLTSFQELRSAQAPVAEGPSLVTASGAGTEVTSEEEEEEEAGATATTAAASEATGGGRQEDAEGAEAAEGAEDLSIDLMQLLRIVDQKNYTSGGQSEVDFRRTNTIPIHISTTSTVHSRSFISDISPLGIL
ncbi:testis-expressed protein 13B [Muntiacus reevesi]|uniref:testis-expressed protein 13B n=1 Tax=Muntiacus reevesi TaxID=9886 RepID=UPI0033073366